MRRPLEDRFWEKVRVAGPDECWLWMGGKTANGYGRFSTPGEKSKYAHRMSWMLANGDIDIPKGMEICHTCDVPACVNPGHLRLWTHAQNMADSARKGRAKTNIGSAHPRAKLVESQVLEIRARHAAGEMQVALALEFGVNHRTIGGIVHRITWQHIGGDVREGPMTSQVGSLNSFSKLVESQVLEIRERHAIGDVTQAVLAADFCVSRRTIGFIVNRGT